MSIISDAKLGKRILNLSKVQSYKYNLKNKFKQTEILNIGYDLTQILLSNGSNVRTNKK